LFIKSIVNKVEEELKADESELINAASRPADREAFQDQREGTG